ncbi:glycosyltransferase family 4 protein [Gordonia sp. N1V]|uniref:glycosyltransferase family 4 protein n=1 Tax=Gordonia sp. N1V TaxID=3034163 RepID=UPI0023E0ED15|nr:glycosyltransferase family 4 protein [Gordonia sp. N1V]MDF3284676.1 glycosyltransferase family 4 protein [Gordonia sp. N1V]
MTRIKPRRVAVVHSFYNAATPSGENSVVNTQVAALEKMYEVELLARRTPEVSSTITYLARSSMYSSGIFSDESILRNIADFRPDIVHVHNTFPNIGTTWAKRCRVPIVTTIHNYRSVCANGLLWRDGNDCSLCPTRGTQHSVIHRCYRASALATIPLAISTRRSARGGRLLNSSAALVFLNPSALAKMERYVSDVAKVVIPNFAPKPTDTGARAPAERVGWAYVGRITLEKNVRWLVKQKMYRDEPLFIAGAGPDSEAVAASLSSFGSSRTKMLGQITETEVDRLLGTVRGLIVPSLWSEGLPTVAIKALAAGCPVLISKMCDSADQIVAGGAGLVFDPMVSSGATSLSAAQEIVADRQMFHSARASQRFTSDFSESIWSERMDLLYRNVLKQKAGQAID